MLLSTLTKAVLGERHHRRSRMFGCIVVCLALGVMPMQVLAEDTLAEDTLVLDQDVSGGTNIPEHIMRKLMQDPEVAEANARTCQAIHSLGLSRAEARPQVSGTISGSKQMIGRIKPNPPFNLFRKLTPEQKEIRDTGAHNRQYDHREKDNIYDAKVSLRVNVYDWGGKQARIDTRIIAHQIAHLEASHKLEERSANLLNLALRLEFFENVLANQVVTSSEVKKQIDAVESRVTAGVGRISELREARLLALDIEIETSRIMAQRDILIEQLATGFDLTPSDAKAFLGVFLRNRPEDIILIKAEETEKAHILRLRREMVTHQITEIKAGRYPRFDGVLDGTIFDVTDYKDEYELIGKLEFTMPLYDGGAASARLREASWRSREAKAALEGFYRNHNVEMERLVSRFQDVFREEQEADARLLELVERLRSLEAIEGQTATSPLILARLQVDLGRAKMRLIETNFERESVRSQLLSVAEKLNKILLISNGEAGC